MSQRCARGCLALALLGGACANSALVDAPAPEDAAAASPAADAGKDRHRDAAPRDASALERADAPAGGANVDAQDAQPAQDSAVDCACEPRPEATAGVLVSAGRPCPDGFGPQPITLGNDVVAPPCAGCLCARARVICSSTVYAFAMDGQAACMAAPDGTGGQARPITSGQLCDTLFAYEPMEIPAPSGLRLGPLALSGYHPCMPRGEAAPPPASFRTTALFCPAVERVGGCGPGARCVGQPRPPGGRACVLLPGAVGCPEGTAREGGDWFLGIDDQRKCGACTCGAPSGGDCAGMHLQIGGEALCYERDRIALFPGGKVCFEHAGGLYQPGMMLVGDGTRGRCTPAVTTSGGAKPARPATLCCFPGAP